MIYIISEKKDLVTDLVIEWIKPHSKKINRFNDDDFLKNYNDYFLKINVQKVWVRRGTFNLLPKGLFKNFSNKNIFLNYLNDEVKEYSIYLEYILKGKLGENYFGSFTKEVNTNNKLINLDIAKKVGFNTPITLITSSKKELLSFYKKNKMIISKDLRAPVNLVTKRKAIISTGVKLINDKMLSNLEDYFAPIFTQKYIDKKYEVRVFLFSKRIYSMAIFSQNDEKTKIDYRNYNDQKQNRCVPILLPKEIEIKLWDFMNQVEMNTGSIDLIVTPKNEFYFLEINPMGQFHWLSANCNYYIERDIANILTA